jgi:hypothetical protein
MAVTHDPRPPYREETHNLFPEPHDPSSTTDTVGALWVLVPAVAAVLVLIWLISATTVQPPVVSVDPNAKPAVETQPITPPAPVPAIRPAPTP